MPHRPDHKCETSSIVISGRAREKCSFCAAKAISADKRSGTMKTVIEGEQLQLEMQDLQDKLRGWVQNVAVNTSEGRQVYVQDMTEVMRSPHGRLNNIGWLLNVLSFTVTAPP